MFDHLISQVLNHRYRVDSAIGRGGMAEVYKVWDQRRATFLAMKLLREDLAEDKIFIRRFRREAKTLSQLQHPHIVRFYGLEQDGPLAFILMDLVEGTSLRRDIFEAGGPFPLIRIMKIMHPVCSALHYAHSKGFIHCDIKPGNILIDHNGRVLVTDFGIARMTESATATMIGAGTPAYMAPEQVRGQDPTPQTDIYTLGTVLFEMLTDGERPFTGEQAQVTGSTAEKVRWEHLRLPPPSPQRYNPNISPNLASIVLKCLEKVPERRFENLLELLKALEREELLIQIPSIDQKKQTIADHQIEEPVSPQVLEQKPRRKPFVAIRARSVIGIALIVVVILAGVIFVGEFFSDELPLQTPISCILYLGEILFTSDRDGKREIYHVNSSGEVVRVTKTFGSAESWGPVTVYGRQTLFTSDRGGKREIYHVNSSGEVVWVTSTPDNAESWGAVPVFGGQTLFTSDRGGKREIYNLNSSGEVVRVTKTFGSAESWGPVTVFGRQTLFTSDRGGKREIYHVNSSGEIEQVTSTPDNAESWGAVPVFGRQILFTSDRDGKREIYNLNSSGEAVKVTNTPGSGESWGPVPVCGGEILFTSDREGKREIYYLNTNGDAVRITNTPGNAESWGPFPIQLP